jgi:hypothetical protein
MNIDELYRLATWYAEQYPELIRLYNELLGPINHNASQPDKRPIEAQLNALAEFLANPRFDELSIEQLKMLTSIGVDTYLGQEGANYVNSVVRTSNYDPATAVDRLNAAVQGLNNAGTLLAAYAEAARNLGFGEDHAEAADGLITIRVGFQNDVAINTVTDWKDTAKEWYDIIRGLSMACEEKPEDVKVIGADTGSVILILAGTAVFAALLARISKNITGVAKDVISVRVEMENLRQKSILTKTMEVEFKRIEKEKTDGAVTTIEKLIEDKIKDKDGDVRAALISSVKKLLTFNEKGGTVDFVSPEKEEGSADAGDGLRAALIEAQEAIREYRGERESLKLLSDGTNSANS